MGKDFTIYLAGAMKNITFDESNGWRKKIIKRLQPEYLPINSRKAVCINPNKYYNYQDNTAYASEKEVMEFDLYKLRHSDLIVVNLDYIESMGTMAEIAIAYELKIPILILKEDGKEQLHPWQKEMSHKIFTNMDALTHYITKYYLSY